LGHGRGIPSSVNHSVINTVCQLAFFTSQDQVGIKYKDRFVSVLDDNDEPEVPNSMVSAVVTAVRLILMVEALSYCVLLDFFFSTGSEVCC
jgi:hypothetical protein